ncbi:MAG: hypothetical protein HY553_23175 [Elusimicrobia bacterium]|nr:hypothetical protein [Elusimicrobiota bacterium]
MKPGRYSHWFQKLIALVFVTTRTLLVSAYAEAKAPAPAGPTPTWHEAARDDGARARSAGETTGAPRQETVSHAGFFLESSLAAPGRFELFLLFIGLFAFPLIRRRPSRSRRYRFQRLPYDLSPVVPFHLDSKK